MEAPSLPVVPGPPPIIIAEAGVNHNGSIDIAFELVRVAARAGADMVKFQAFSADGIVAPDAPTARYQADRTQISSQHELLRALELSDDDFARIADECGREGIQFLCTPFSLDSLASLVALGMPAIKVASGELTNHPALVRFAGTGLPIYLSTGMAEMAEVGIAIEVLQLAGSGPITLLQCTSLYPAPAETLNLLAMRAMADQFSLPIGFSDHSVGITAAIAATALGATVIEKHFTLDRAMPGPDHAASLEPDELAKMIGAVREVHQALGSGLKAPGAAEKETAALVRRSWHAVRPIAAGQSIGETDIELRRPANGLAPDDPPIGRIAARDLVPGTALTAADLRPIKDDAGSSN